MTDKEKLVALLTEFGVGFKEYKNYNSTVDVVECRQGDPKVGGYTGFFADFTFDLSGKFIEVGVGE